MQQMMSERASRIQSAQDDNVKNMGEGSDKMMQKMMEEMPLGATVSYGAMTAEQLDELLMMLNA